MVAHASLMASGYVVAVVLARGLGPTRYGEYGIIYSFLLGVELIGRFGVPQALSKLIAERENGSRRLEATGITLTAGTYLVLFLLFWLCAPRLATLFHLPAEGQLFRIAALDIPFFGLYFTAQHILNGRRQFERQATTTFIYALAKVAAVVALLQVGVSVAGALLANVAASIVALAVAAFWVGRPSFLPSLGHRGELVRRAIPIGLFALGAQVLLSLDLWSLNAIGDAVPQDVKGLYVAATNVARIPNIAAFVATAVVIPTISRAAAVGDANMTAQTVRGIFALFVVVLLPGCGVIAAYAEEALQLLFGETYRAGGTFLRILIISHGLFSTALVTACAVLFAGGYAGLAAALPLGLLPLALALSLILVPAAGATGAALASLSVLGPGTVAAGALVHFRVASLAPRGPLLLAGCGILLVIGLAAFIRVDGALWIAKSALLVAMYVIVLRASGLVGRDQFAFLLGRVPPGQGEEAAGISVEAHRDRCAQERS